MKHIITIYLLLFLFTCEDQVKPLASPTADSAHHLPQPHLAENVIKHIKYQDKVIALTHATIIDGKGNPARDDQTIIVANGYFQAIGPASEIDIPVEATVIDVGGKTIIPGLVGMHNHLHIPRFPFVGDIASKLYLAAGVTTIQTCGAASPQQEVELARQIEAGEHIGPDIVTSGPYFTGPGGNPNMIIPNSEQQIRDTIRYWTERGVRWFKVYRHTSPDDLAVIIRGAHQQGANVTGHLCSITFEQAVQMGIDGIEHGLNSVSDFRENKTDGHCNGSRTYMDSLDITSPAVKRLQQLMIDHDVFLTSTLAIYESSIPNRAVADRRSLAAMSPYLLEQYRTRRQRLDSLGSEDMTREKRLKRIMAFERQFVALGGTLVAGCDAGRHVLPGFGDQRNFELLLEAGFTTETAIQIMTSNGAKVMANQEVGSIETGKRADFIIIDGKLKEDPTYIRQVEWVFKTGLGYDPQSIMREVQGKFGLP